MNEAPFEEGEIVMRIGNEHFGPQRVVECRWVGNTAPGVEPYWRVRTEPLQQQEHIYSSHSGSADSFTRVDPK